MSSIHPDAEAVFHILSVSNASLDVFPNNTLTRFTHRLSRTIKIPRDLRVSIALSVACLEGLKEDAQDISYVKIHLRELDPTVGSDQNESRVLARIPFKKHDYFYCRKEIPVFLPLLAIGEELKELSFFITDEQNRQLQLKDGHPTVLHLEMVLSKSADSFSITLNSDISKHLYPSNDLTTFSVEMPQSLVVDPDMEVALHSIQVPQAVMMETAFLEFVFHRGTEFDPRFPFAKYKEDKVIRIPVHRKKLTEEFIFGELLKPLLDFGLLPRIHGDGEYQIGRTLAWNAPEMIKIREKYNMTVEKHQIAAIYFSPFTAEMLKLPQEYNRGYVHQLPWDRFPHTVRKGFKEFDYYATLRQAVPDFLAVYCNIVESSLVGNTFGPFVDIYPVGKLGLIKEDKEVFYTVKHPIFRGVNHNLKKTVEVAIRTLDGSIPPIMFNRELHPIKHQPISLHFVFRKRIR